MNRWAAVGAINAALAVGAGAFGAHALRARLTADMLVVYETAARYHMYHALGLVAVGWLGAEQGKVADLPGWAMLIGIALFCGSLYALALTGTRAFGAVTPFGGLAFLVAWAGFARAVLSSR